MAKPACVQTASVGRAKCLREMLAPFLEQASTIGMLVIDSSGHA